MLVGQLHLIATKLCAPIRRAGLVHRHRLLRALQGTTDGKLTVVAAPAGFGKSTLLAQWHSVLREKNVAVGWVSLDRDDNDLARFLSYLISSLRKAHPQVGEGALTLIHSSPIVPVASIMTLLVNDLAAIEGRIALILDDYHVIEQPEIHEAIESLLAYAPPNFHLVIASRCAPMLPLARFRARGQIVELQGIDLRFDLEETAEFLNRIRALDLSREDIETLLQRTEGWAAALQLASLSLDQRTERASFIHSFSGSDRDITDFLAGDVLMRQSQTVQSFLLKTAVLERMNADLCDRVTGESSARDLLERIDSANLFLVALDNERQWFRYHHLFADFLRGQLRRLYPGIMNDLHRRACDWYAEAGLTADAVRHALAAGDLDRAAALVEGCAMDLIQQSHVTHLREWLRKLPGEVIHRRPRLQLSYVWILFHISEPREAARLLAGARRSLKAGLGAAEASIDALTAELKTLTVGVASAADQSRRACRLALRWIDDLPDDQPFLSGTLGNILGYNYYSLGALPAARDACNRARHSHIRAKSVFGIVYSDMLLGLIEKAAGNLFEAGRLFQQAQEIARQALGPRSYAEVMNSAFLGELFYEWNDVNAAERLIRENQKIIEECALVIHVIAGLTHLARLEAARGRLGAALAILDRADGISQDKGSRRLRAAVLNERVRLLLSRNDLVAARLAVTSRGLDPDDGFVARKIAEGDPAPSTEFEHLAVARLLIAEGAFDHARSLLDHLASRMEAEGRGRRWVQTLALKAIGLSLAGEGQAAGRLLWQVLTRAEPQRYMRTFIDEGRPMKDLLEAMLSGPSPRPEASPRALPVKYAKHILAGFQPSVSHREGSTSAEVSYNLVEPLSGRERDVVRLLATGKSNQELARHLSLAPDTVKWHLKNIFEKLGVNNRTQAILAAQQLNLLH
jgi:LuxR family transcriptional regulator, maltose regulon positive regulatory protein